MSYSKSYPVNDVAGTTEFIDGSTVLSASHMNTIKTAIRADESYLSDSVDPVVENAVRTTEQTLTSAQQSQARENISAVGTDEMSAEFLCQMLFGNEDDWSVANYDSTNYSATKTGRTITYKGNNTSNSGFQSVNLTGVPGAPHTARSGNFSNIALADTDFVPIPTWLANVSNDNTAIVRLLGYFHADRYNADIHTGYAVDYVLRKYDTETGEYKYSTRTTTPLGPINTATTADAIDKISVAQLIPDSRGGDYVKNWSEWEEIAIFAIRRNRMFSGTVLLTPAYESYGNQKPVVYSAEQTLTATEQQQARSNIVAADETMFEAVTGFVPFDGTDGSASNRNCTVTRVGQRYTIKRTAEHTSNSDFSLMPNIHGANYIASGTNYDEWCAEATLKLVPGRRYRVALRVVSGAVLGGNFVIRLRNESNVSLSSQAVSTERTSVDFTFSGTYFALMMYVTSTFYTGETPLVFDLTLTEIPADASIAGTEQVVAKDSHDAGALMMVSGQLYKAKQAIVAGDTITPGVNVEETTVAAQLAALEDRIAALEG